MNATPNYPAATTVAVDLAKEIFELAFADASGRIVARQRLKRESFAGCLINRTPLHVVMEACGSAHHWARTFARSGHRVADWMMARAKAHPKAEYTNATAPSWIIEARASAGKIKNTPRSHPRRITARQG